MFAGLRSESDWNIDGEMLWGYYFTAAAPEMLESVAESLSERGFDISEIFESDDEPIFILQAERLEKHTPESLFALNAELEVLASKFEGVDSESEPIENPELVAAIQKFASNGTEDSQYDLTLQLQRGLYLVPVYADDAHAAPAEEGSLQVLVCTDEEDAEFLPLFTDEAVLKAWTKEKVSAMVLTAPEAWEFILSQPECSGAVVNPGDAGLPLSREMITLLKKMIDEIEAETEE